MINQQLLDFIKDQKLRGVDNETIKKNLLGGGWNKEDIKEGLSFISSQINNQTNQSAPGSLSDSIQLKGSHFVGKKVLLIVIAFLIIAGGISIYYFRNDIPVIKDLIKSKNIALVSGINKEEKNLAKIEPNKQLEPDKKTETVALVKLPVSNSPIQSMNTPILHEKDCGVSKDIPMLDEGWESSYEGDQALKCIGESALSCTNAKVIINGGNPLDKNPALLQIINNSGVCNFKFTGYQKKYNQCPLNVVKELDFEKSTNTNFVYKDNTGMNASKYAAVIYNYAMMSMSLTLDSKESSKLGCTGNLSQTMSTMLTESKNNINEEQILLGLQRAIFDTILYYEYRSLSDLTGACSDDPLKTHIINLDFSGLKSITCFDSKDTIALSALSPKGGYMCSDNYGLPTTSSLQNNITRPRCK